MADPLPAITGIQLAGLFRKDGWAAGRNSREGTVFTKQFADRRTRVTVIPRKRRPLTPGTLSAILLSKQSGIGRDGLRALIDKYGL
jgi:hypothetical protein